MVGSDRIRYTLYAQAIGSDGHRCTLELSREVDAVFLLDKVAHRQAVPTPEDTFEELWQQLKSDIDACRG
jgi:hypothetical protein